MLFLSKTEELTQTKLRSFTNISHDFLTPLTLTKDLVELHHGTISVKSELNKGAKFFFTIPIDEASYNEVELGRLKNEKGAENISLDSPTDASEMHEDNPTVLLVEDNEEFLKEAILLIEENLTEYEFDINAFAEGLKMSKSSLYRKIKTMTGLSPIEFIRNIKLKHACKMLKQTSMTISEVAYSSGFSDPKYFATCFRAEFGMTPRNYQKTLTEKE